MELFFLLLQQKNIQFKIKQHQEQSYFNLIILYFQSTGKYNNKNKIINK